MKSVNDARAKMGLPPIEEREPPVGKVKEKKKEEHRLHAYPIRISLSLAMLASYILPSIGAGDFGVDPGYYRELEAGERAIALAVVRYWIPAFIFYVVIQFLPRFALFRLTKGEARVLGIATTIYLLYVVVRLFAATVPGGGAGFVVAQFSVFTALPALVVIGIAWIKIFVRAVSKRAIPFAPERGISLLSSIFVAAVGIAPIVYFVWLLYGGPDSPYMQTRMAKTRMEQLCATTEEIIYQVPTDVRTVYIDEDWGIYDKGPGGMYSVGTVSHPLVNSKLVEYVETKAHRRQGYIRQWTAQRNEVVPDVSASYGVFRKSVLGEEDQKLGIAGYELSVKRLATDETLASIRFFVNTKQQRTCGPGNAPVMESVFIMRALGLRKP